MAGSKDKRVTSLEVPQYESPPMIMTNLSGGGPVMVVVGVVVVVIVVVLVVVAVQGVSRSYVI